MPDQSEKAILVLLRENQDHRSIEQLKDSLLEKESGDKISMEVYKECLAKNKNTFISSKAENAFLEAVV